MRLKKEDEMSCLVGGCNFLLQAIRHEAFEFRDNETTFMSHYPGARARCSMAWAARSRRKPSSLQIVCTLHCGTHALSAVVAHFRVCSY